MAGSQGGTGGGARSAGSQRAIERARDGSGKELVNMVVVGHVDAGKSTLMGQLLVETGQVSARQLHKYKKEATEMGKGSFFLAWVMDEDPQERAHGVTIDVAQKVIETPSKVDRLSHAIPPFAPCN